jgi:ribosome-binding protein aMBF1 (putative translation factor)
MKLLNDIFRRIEASRSRHGWSKNRWGREVLNNPNALYDYESGKRSPNGRTLQKIETWLLRDEKPVSAGVEGLLE